jgi:tRNA (mo5U34)-methyltransferase
MDLSDLLVQAHEYKARLAAARSEIGDGIVWYQYDILANLWHLDALLHGENRDLGSLAAGLPVADIGGADGDLAFMLEQAWGWEIDLIDHAPTNQNGLRGARALRDHLESRVRIEDVDLDSQFVLPREHYGLVLMLGTLYHLQNPFFVLRELSRRAEHCLISTRVARFAGTSSTPVADLPVAYLVGPSETNNDATNYWMFSPTGLERIVERAGWSVVERTSMGDVVASDPSSAEHDERMLLLLRSARLDQGPPSMPNPDATRVTKGLQPGVPDGRGDALTSGAYEQRTRQLHEARGALAEAVSALTTELNQRREERNQALRENRALREQADALNTEIQNLRQHWHAAHEENVAFRNMKVVRWTASPRRFVYRLRARRG